MGARTESLIILIAFLVAQYHTIPRYVYRPLLPFLLLYGLQLLFIPMSFDVRYSFEMWMIEASRLVFSAFIIGSINDSKGSEMATLYVWLLSAIFILIVGYGLYLTSMPGINPYQILLQPIFGGEFNEAYAAGNGGLSNVTDISDGRIFGRISSVFRDPQRYALELGLVGLFVFGVVKNIKYQIPLLAIIFYAIVSCGVRTPLVALPISLVFVLLYLRKYNYMFSTIVLMAFIFVILPYLSPELSEYIYSVFDSGNNSSVGGSSIEMRLEQFDSCVEIIRDSPLFGRGYSWTVWYMEKFGAHPGALCFESIIFSVMCNSGLMGFAIWGIVVVYYIKIISEDQEYEEQKVILYSILIYYFAFTVVTGEYGYLPQFMVVYTVLYGYFQYCPQMSDEYSMFEEKKNENEN